jgi:FAD-dependent urate hydroxylase
MKPRILIVGGGIAGLSLAIALKRRGMTAEIVECANTWMDAGTGLYLIGLATRALASLGIPYPLAAECTLIHTQTIRNPKGRKLAEIGVDAFWSRCGPCLGTARSLLHRVLANEVADLPIQFGTTVRRLAQNADCVFVELSNGSAKEYDLVVGADGIRSSIRRLELGEQEPSFRGQVGWRFIAPRPASLPGWTVYLASDRAFLLIPIADDRVYCYADRAVAQPIDDPVLGRIGHLRRLFRDFAIPVRGVLDTLESSEHVHFAPIEEVRCEQWGRGRVVLIGDAAHAMSPNMACGGALALEDAIVLAQLIERGGFRDIVPDFMQRRLPRVEWVRRETNRRDRLRMSKLPRTLRDLIIRLTASRSYRGSYQPLLAEP